MIPPSMVGLKKLLDCKRCSVTSLLGNGLQTQDHGQHHAAHTTDIHSVSSHAIKMAIGDPFGHQGRTAANDGLLEVHWKDVA